MKLSEIMTRNVDVIRPDATIKEAAKMMDDIDVGALPICDGEKLLGMLTDRDIVIRSISEGQDPNSTSVRDVMTDSQLVYCFEDDQVDSVASKMKQNQIRRIPVLSRDSHKLVGIVSLGDLAVKSDDDRLLGDVTEEVSKPEKPAA